MGPGDATFLLQRSCCSAVMLTLEAAPLLTASAFSCAAERRTRPMPCPVIKHLTSPCCPLTASLPSSSSLWQTPATPPSPSSVFRHLYCYNCVTTELPKGWPVNTPFLPFSALSGPGGSSRSDELRRRARILSICTLPPAANERHEHPDAWGRCGGGAQRRRAARAAAPDRPHFARAAAIWPSLAHVSPWRSWQPLRRRPRLAAGRTSGGRPAGDSRPRCAAPHRPAAMRAQAAARAAAASSRRSRPSCRLRRRRCSSAAGSWVRLLRLLPPAPCRPPCGLHQPKRQQQSAPLLQPRQASSCESSRCALPPAALCVYMRSVSARHLMPLPRTSPPNTRLCHPADGHACYGAARVGAAAVGGRLQHCAGGVWRGGPHAAGPAGRHLRRAAGQQVGGTLGSVCSHGGKQAWMMSRGGGRMAAKAITMCER